MHTGDQSADYHERSKDGDCRSHAAPNYPMTNAPPQLHPYRGHHAQCQHSGGRRIGRLQHTFDQHGAIVDIQHLKEAENRQHHNIKAAQNQRAAFKDIL